VLPLRIKIAAENIGCTAEPFAIKKFGCGGGPATAGRGFKISGDQLTYKSHFLLFAF